MRALSHKSHWTNNTYNKKHGMRYTREYKAWCAMKQRCLNSNNPAYHNYGGRGIKICKSWLSSFENFYISVGNCPENYSLDRIDNNKGYTPNNCRWSNRKTQNTNQRIRKDASITPEICTKIKTLLKENPSITQRKIACVLNVDYRVVNRIIHNRTRFT